MLKEKKNLIIYVLIVLVVIAVLVFITIKYKAPENPIEVGTEQNTNMNTQGQVLGDEEVVEQKEKAQPQTLGQEGVKVTILKEGNGEVAKSGDTVAMNYTGTLMDGTVFDSNVDPKMGHVQPFVFTIDGGQVIKGWDIGVAGMKVGEVRKLELKPEFAYGERGAGTSIPPNATLVFEVQLLGIKK